MVRKIIKWWPVLFVSALLFVPKISLAAGWVNIGFADQNVKTVTVNSKNNQHILVSLTSQLNSNYNYYTENGGSTWQPVSMSGPVTNCNNFVINSKLPTEIWAGCAMGVFHSADAGKTFSSVTNFRYLQAAFVNVATDGTVYVTSQGNNLFRSADGVVWETLNVPGSSTVPIVFTNKYNASEIYLSHSGGINPGLYKSSDHGSSWQLLNNQFPIRNGVAQMAFEASGKICVSADIMGIGCSTDGGFSWTQFVSPNPDKPIEYQHFYNLVQNPDDDANNLILAGTWSGQDTKIYGYQSTATTPSVFDSPQMVGSISVSQGVTYVYASNPGWTKGLWRNDGIATMPEYLKKHPIIIVPGILGSWPVKGVWKIDPILNTYTNLVETFKANNYELGKDLFVFPYDWHKDNVYTATLLKQKIDEAKRISGAIKVDIVAHSMGGLVARSYAESDYYTNDIDQIIFLGTPHLGSAKSYPTWEAGDAAFEGGIMGGLLNYLLTEEAKTKGYNGDAGLFDYIHSNVPTVNQLLPITNYLERNNLRLKYPDGYPRNQFLENLDINKGFIHDRGINVTNIVGLVPDRTVDHYAVQDVMMGLYWIDGMPLNYYTTGGGIFRDLGDNTVTLNSQTGLLGDVLTMPGVSHNDLPKKSTKEVLGALDIIGQSIETVAAINKYLLIAAYSPVDFYVLAPDGKRLGFNKDGAVFNEIEGAFYAGNDSETEFLTIPNPLPGEYKVMTYGTGTGGYEIEATYADDENNSTATASYVGQAAPGKVDKLLVTLSPDSNTIETKIDDKTSPITTATLQGNMVNGYYNTDVVVTLTAVDYESGLKKTEYSLDGILWQDYSRPIQLTIDGGSSLHYRSVDNAGNVENAKEVSTRIDKTAPTVILKSNRTSLTHWDALRLNCEVGDNYSGVDSFSVKLDGTEVKCKEDINIFNQALGVHKIEYEAADKAGNNTSGEIVYQLIANYDSTLRDIYWLYDDKHFKSWGDANSVYVHVQFSWLFDILGLEAKSKEFLARSQFLLDKQSTKNKVSNYGYDMITRDIKYILEGK